MFKKLRTVVYHVDDLEAAKNWYTKVTGITPYFDQPFYVGFDINGSELGLDPDMTGVEKGNHSFAYWAVEDINKAITEIAALGGTILSDLQDVGGGTQVAVMGDLWGNAIGLIQEG